MFFSSRTWCWNPHGFGRSQVRNVTQEEIEEDRKYVLAVKAPSWGVLTVLGFPWLVPSLWIMNHFGCLVGWLVMPFSCLPLVWCWFLRCGSSLPPTWRFRPRMWWKATVKSTNRSRTLRDRLQLKAKINAQMFVLVVINGELMVHGCGSSWLIVVNNVDSH